MRQHHVEHLDAYLRFLQASSLFGSFKDQDELGRIYRECREIRRQLAREEIAPTEAAKACVHLSAYCESNSRWEASIRKRSRDLLKALRRRSVPKK